MKPLGIAANLEKPQVPRVSRLLLSQLARLRQPVLLERELALSLGRAGGVEMRELGRRCRMLILLGGDGTVLRAARELHPHETPIFSVNLGKLGFLASIAPERLKQALPRVIRGKARIIEHSTLAVSIHSGRRGRKGWIALNDAVISRGAVSRVAELEVHVDGERLNSYLCDGIIFSTATGSTAYSLSAGGPIVTPTASVYAITPICPHTLSNRSVIVGERSVAEVRIIRQPDELFLGLDGQSMIRLSPDDRVRVTIGRYKVRRVVLPGDSFFDLLRKKLRWTGSNI